MNDNEPWPRIGQASNSTVIRALAKAADWQLAEMPADLGLPLAGCLDSDVNDLLGRGDRRPAGCLHSSDGQAVADDAIGRADRQDTKWGRASGSCCGHMA